MIEGRVEVREQMQVVVGWRTMMIGITKDERVC